MRLGLLVASILLFPAYWLLMCVPTPSVPMLTGQTRDLRHEENFQRELQQDLGLSLSVAGIVLLCAGFVLGIAGKRYSRIWWLVPMIIGAAAIVAGQLWQPRAAR